MPRDHGRIYTSIWRDRDWIALPPMAQWLYEQFVSRAEINHAGVIPLNLRKWAKGAAGVTVADIDEWLATLAAARFVVVDEDTDEVLVRSFIRGDGIAKQPNILVSACRLARQVESPAIRAALAVELRRIGAELTNEKALGEVFQAVVELDPDGPEPPRPTTIDTPGRSMSGTQMGLSVQGPMGVSKSRSGGRSEDIAELSDEGSVEPFPEPHGGGEGVGEGGSSSVGGQVGGSRTRPRASAHARGAPRRSATHDEQRCGRRHDPEKACRQCAAKRAAEEVASSDEQRAAVVASLPGRRCRMCDADEWLLEVGRAVPVAPYRHCDHETPHETQVARARGAS